jgi:hypothetical protein
MDWWHSAMVQAFFFLGRYDHVIAPETSKANFDMLTATPKTLVWTAPPACSRRTR